VRTGSGDESEKSRLPSDGKREKSEMRRVLSDFECLVLSYWRPPGCTGCKDHMGKRFVEVGHGSIYLARWGAYRGIHNRASKGM
jgi:hypothetical protein